jgi:hypothetical protein
MENKKLIALIVSIVLGAAGIWLGADFKNLVCSAPAAAEK